MNISKYLDKPGRETIPSQRICLLFRSDFHICDSASESFREYSTSFSTTESLGHIDYDKANTDSDTEPDCQ